MSVMYAHFGKYTIGRDVDAPPDDMFNAYDVVCTPIILTDGGGGGGSVAKLR